MSRLPGEQFGRLLRSVVVLLATRSAFAGRSRLGAGTPTARPGPSPHAAVAATLTDPPDVGSSGSLRRSSHPATPGPHAGSGCCGQIHSTAETHHSRHSERTRDRPPLDLVARRTWPGLPTALPHPRWRPALPRTSQPLHPQLMCSGRFSTERRGGPTQSGTSPFRWGPVEPPGR